MSLFDDEAPRKKAAISIGDDLARLSVDELEERIAALKEEIARVEQAIAAKRASASVADSFFRRSGE